MAVIVRLILIATGSVTALFIARDALNFPIFQAVAAILLIAGAMIAWVALNASRGDDGESRESGHRRGGCS